VTRHIVLRGVGGSLEGRWYEIEHAPVTKFPRERGDHTVTFMRTDAWETRSDGARAEVWKPVPRR
jgi:hypothetical protein